jgi:translocation and assembly module TamA
LPRRPTRFAPLCRHAVCALALFCLAGPALAKYRVELDAQAPLKSMLSDFLDLMRYRDRDDINADQLDFMVATASEQVRDLAATEGYFSTKTQATLERGNGRPLVKIRVESGPRTMVTSTHIDVTGPAQTEAPQQAQRLVNAWPLKPGEPFRQADWTAAKDGSLRELTRHSYAAAKLASSRAEIHAEREAADLFATYDSGPAFTLGPLAVTGTRRYPERIVRNVNPLHPGEPYDVDRLLELQRAILRTPYFSNAVVDIDHDPAHPDRTPVDVRVTEYPTQRLRGGVGYATDTGARIEGRYTHNNVFGRAWVLDSQLRIEQRRQLGSIDLAMPPDSGAWTNSGHVSSDRTTLAGIDLRSRRVGLRRARSTEKDDYAYTLEYYRDRLDQIDGTTLPSTIVAEPGSHQALVAGYARTHRAVDDPLFPRRGYVASLEAGVAAKGVLTDQSFFRFYGKGRRYLPVGKTDLVLLRAEFGAVISKPGNAAIPASLLFRAGGTDSVRGYAYQSIGNEVNGTVYPTRYVATGSVEYQHWFTHDWGGAVFYDVGAATDSWSHKNFFHGVGFGVRWRSPVGPVNADLGYGIQNHNVRPHFSLGVAF